MVAASKDQSAVEAPKHGGYSSDENERLAGALLKSTFLSVCQHMITLQSEFLVLQKLKGGDGAATTAMLGSSTGLANLLGVIFNQIGGCMSDRIGRKAGLLVGPMGNVLVGAILYTRPSQGLLLVLRTVRMMITTFSNTVTLRAIIADKFTATDGAIIGPKIGSTVGISVLAMPIVEGLLLTQLKSPKLSYLFLALLGAIQSVYAFNYVPETLPEEKRGLPIDFSVINPLGFMEIYRRGSATLQKVVNIITLQTFVEGKNLSDFSYALNTEQMGWGVKGITAWISIYGTLCTVSTGTLTPFLMKRFSTRGYATFTNLMTAAVYIARIFIAKRLWLYLGTVPFMLPGVNGAASFGLQPLATAQAEAEGFGNGEFAAYTTNLRSIMSAIASSLLSNSYAFCAKNGIVAGGPYFWVSFFGGLLPQWLLSGITDEELKGLEKCAAAKKAGGTPAAQAKGDEGESTKEKRLSGQK